MKYGKEFKNILNESDFPDDWKTSAIEYNKLKKLIKNVVAELEGMGLSPAVLNKLLVADQPEASGTSGTITELHDEPAPFEFEFEVDSPRTTMGHVPSPKEVLLDPVFDEDELPDQHLPHRFRVRMRSDAGISPLESPSSPAPLSVTEMLRARGETPLTNGLARERKDSSPSGSRRVVTRSLTDGVSAEYVFGGSDAQPVPHIKLLVQDVSSLPRSSIAEASATDTDSDDDDDDDGGLLVAPRGELSVPASPSALKIRTVSSPIWALASSGNTAGMADLSLGDAARANGHAHVEHRQPMTEAELGQSPSEREFIIPLQSDVRFFSVLTAALTSLSEFHAAQQQQFRADVAQLCKSISQSIMPGDGVIVLPTPLNAAPSDSTVVPYSYRPSPNQKDLYAWREIFSLWIESEIFESSSERDRGERSVDEAERRLQSFANEVVRRGLGDRRSIKGKRTRKAWEEFLRLNVLLLDLKRFQTANINAARKILKKHDKRTALSASAGLQAFVRGTISAHVSPDGSVSTWTFYNTSLPHVLLASLTDTLLPILPSLDDYACLICMSIAFKPIRLTCGHLFCVRCLVKMQQRGKEGCPLCRSETVLLADKRCLDVTLMNFMKEWFPREVKEKQRENSAEIAKETLEDAGLDTKSCVVM